MAAGEETAAAEAARQAAARPPEDARDVRLMLALAEALETQARHERSANAAGDSLGYRLAVALGLQRRVLEWLQREPEVYRRPIRQVTLKVGALLTETGEPHEALALLVKLYRDAPEDLLLNRSLGLAYEGAGRWKDALSRWRYLASKIKTTTNLWYESKYHIARCLYRSGDKSHALLQVIALTQALHPELGGPELKKRFEDLEREMR